MVVKELSEPVFDLLAVRADVQPLHLLIERLNCGLNHRELLPFDVHVDQIHPAKTLEQAGERQAGHTDRPPATLVPQDGAPAVGPVGFPGSGQIVILGHALSVPRIRGAIKWTSTRAADVKEHCPRRWRYGRMDEAVMRGIDAIIAEMQVHPLEDRWLGLHGDQVTR